MFQVGCRYLNLGAESGNDQVLASMASRAASVAVARRSTIQPRCAPPTEGSGSNGWEESLTSVAKC